MSENTEQKQPLKIKKTTATEGQKAWRDVWALKIVLFETSLFHTFCQKCNFLTTIILIK